MSHTLAVWWPLFWALALLTTAAALLAAVSVEVARQVLGARGGAGADLGRLRLLIGANLALIAAMYLIPA